ncbi:MAG: NUDIX hydrolase [Minisyncoccota bacterium]
MNKYQTEDSGIKTEYIFFEGSNLPENIPISTPLTFAFIGQNLVVVKKKNGWWDVVGGKIEQGEKWHDALKREAYEEAGILIDHIEIIGYVLVTNSGDESKFKFPRENVIPVTFSFVKEVDRLWNPRETLERDALQKDEVRKLFSLRSDNDQLLDIYNFVLSEYKKKGYDYSFTYLPYESVPAQYPNTQSVTFIKTPEDRFIVVREGGAVAYTLPGGGCHLDESPLDCAIRETREEAQLEICNVRLLGEVIVKVILYGETLSISKQSRFIADMISKNEFIPERGGFETVERKEIPFKELADIELLKNDTGIAILADLKKKL